MNKINDELNSNEELNYIIENYIVAKGVSYILECIEGGDRMYSKMFELINNELNSIILNTPVEPFELKKIEIKGIKVKLLFLNHNKSIVRVMNYEFDWLNSELKLKLKKDYTKPFRDKYFR